MKRQCDENKAASEAPCTEHGSGMDSVREGKELIVYIILLMSFFNNKGDWIYRGKIIWA